MNTQDHLTAPVQSGASTPALKNADHGKPTHGFVSSHVDETGVERNFRFIRWEDGATSVRLGTKPPGEEEGVTLVGLSPIGLDMLFQGLIKVIYRMEEHPISYGKKAAEVSA